MPLSWFAEMFGAEKAPKVEAQYADEFEYFEWHTLSEFHSIDKAEKTTIKTVTCGASSPNPPPKPAPASLKPLPEAKVFRTSYSTQHQRFGEFKAEGWTNLYAEVDGHVWFFGSGGYPFWDPVGHADMCAKPGEQTTQGKLITRVEPEYPESAKGKHVGGVVRARLRGERRHNLACRDNDVRSAISGSSQESVLAVALHPIHELRAADGKEDPGAGNVHSAILETETLR